jgi:hypothetical protein
MVFALSSLAARRCDVHALANWAVRIEIPCLRARFTLSPRRREIAEENSDLGNGKIARVVFSLSIIVSIAYRSSEDVRV